MDNQFNQWVDQWQKAQDEGLFKNIPKEEPKINSEIESSEGFFGLLNINADKQPSSEDIEYWSQVQNYSEQDQVLNEEKSLKDHTKKMANSANPIRPDTIGSDSSNKTSKKGFATNDSVEELVKLKDKLFKLENEVLTKEALGKDYKKLEKEMKKIYSIIDKLSDNMNQHRFETDKEEKE
jgi:hypothetical protein